MGIGGPENLGKKNPFFEFLEKERQGRTEKAAFESAWNAREKRTTFTVVRFIILFFDNVFIRGKLPAS